MHSECELKRTSVAMTLCFVTMNVFFLGYIFSLSMAMEAEEETFLIACHALLMWQWKCVLLLWMWYDEALPCLWWCLNKKLWLVLIFVFNCLPRTVEFEAYLYCLIDLFFCLNFINFLSDLNIFSSRLLTLVYPLKKKVLL